MNTKAKTIISILLTGLFLMGIFGLIFVNAGDYGKLISPKRGVIDVSKGQAISLGSKQLAYNSLWAEYPPIQITDSLRENSLLLQGVIINHTKSCGIDCSSIMQLYLANSGSLIDNVKFYTIINDENGTEIDRKEEPIRNYQFYIKDEKDEWTPYKLGLEVPAGNYEVKLEGQKDTIKTIDWQIESQGQWVDSWAVWGGMLVGSEYQIIIKADNVNCTKLAWNNVNCYQITNKFWKLNTTDSWDVSRAEIMYALFWYKNATNSSITNPQALFSPDSRDSNKSVSWIYYGSGGKFDALFTSSSTYTF